MRTLAVLLFCASIATGQSEPTGVLPVGADGKPLNLDFETGTLKDWTAEGDAFAGQPIKGDTIHPRRSDSYSRHQGQYWVGGYERAGDKPQGTLTSVPFKVTQPWASFLVGGGPHAETCVELHRKDTGELILRASGLEEEDMRRVVVDLKGHLGKEIFLRLVDRHSGGWGHVNFDDFRFHAEQPKFPPRQVAPAPDTYKFTGLPPERAAEAMTVPEGFEVKLFAGEPDVVQPIAMCLDDRGRVWVAEAYSYPIRRADKDARDRILIFEDTDGDGKFDKRTVFMEGLNLVSGLEVGFGGVWIGAAPYLLYVPMKDDRAAGEPQILLDGWAFQDTHETLNSFIWGPDGWLYGCHGVFTHSQVGKPGTPAEQRVKINAGVWRYHPTRHVFEVFAHGTSNPWGLDFDDRGQAFVECCVIPHCFHIIQGGRYQRQAGQHFNPHTYADLQTIADHLHWQGANPWAGNNRSDSAGGGHAHCGLMCYLGGTWPEKYRGQLFMGNIHGRRLNVDSPSPKGSGYVASHAPDFLMANDAWARFINMRYGPDGNVYLIDWYDKQACHHGDPKIWDRSNGRIYKICHKDAKPVQVDLGKKTNQELIELQLHPNDWYVRHARRLLQERKAELQDFKRLENILVEHKDETRRLRALWTYHLLGSRLEKRGPDYIDLALEDKSPYVRAWAHQLQFDDTYGLPALQKPRGDPSPIVRLYQASALQRMQWQAKQREAQGVKDKFDSREYFWEVAAELLSHGEDASDQNLPLMYWYAVEPLAEEDPVRGLDLAVKAKVPQILPWMVRRIGALGTPEAVALLVGTLAKIEDASAQLAILRGLSEALKGRRQVEMPRAWPTAFARLIASKNAELRNQAEALALTFGDARAFAELRGVVLAKNTDPGQRQAALDALLAVKDAQLVPVLHQLVADPALRGAAIRGLAAYDAPQTPATLLGMYGSLSPAERRDALNTLASRPAYAKALLDAVADKKLAAADVSAELVRQLRNLRNRDVDRRVAEVWGVARDTPADRLQLIAEYRKKLVQPTGTPPELALGRAIYAKTCQQCHTLFGEGGKVGPDITGANRGDLKYLLENILDPSAFIPKEYAATVLELKSGRVITGIVKGETPAAVTVLTANEALTIPRDEIETSRQLPTSMMPDDLLKNLSEREVRALIAYLQSPVQVALPPEKR